MNINWLLVAIAVLNLFCSTLGDICAKLWGITNNQSWFYAGLMINVVTTLTFMTIIRLGGLAVTTAVVLVLTIVINVCVGSFAFGENISTTQMVGIGLGLISIALSLGLWNYPLSWK